MTFTEVMLDIETLATTPDAMMISLGAALRTPDGLIHTIELPIETVADDRLAIDPGTVRWWLRQDEPARASVSGKGMSLLQACINFNNALSSFVRDPKELRVWGNGSMFDNVIVKHNYKIAGVEPVWGYRNDMCYRTLKNLYPQIPYVAPENAHIASEDAKAQLIHLEKILQVMNVGGRR